MVEVWATRPDITFVPYRERITPREREVLNLIAQGSKQKEIASKLSLSPNTVKERIHNLYSKFDTKANDTTDELNQQVKLVIKGILGGVIDLPPLLEDFDSNRSETLSRAEKAVLEFIIDHEGEISQNSHIGKALFISESTVKSHLLSSYRKLKAKNKPHAIARYMATKQTAPLQ